MDELLTLAETAELLKIKPSTLRAWILRRKLPYCKVGRLVRIRRADLDKVIEDSLVPARLENAGRVRQPKGLDTASLAEKAAGCQP